MGNYLCHAALVALIAIASAQGKWIMTEASAQTATQAQGRELPVFEVDKSWPKVPPQYKVGDVSSINSDSEGNIYVLHRPRTLKDLDFGQAAPAVLVFDPNGMPSLTERRSAKRTRTVTVRPGRDLARSRLATLSARWRSVGM